MLSFKQFLIEGLVNQRNYSHFRGEDVPWMGGVPNPNSNFWASLYDAEEAKLLTPEQKSYLERITGSEQHERSKLGSYTGENSAQTRLQTIRDQDIEKFKKLDNFIPNHWDRTLPEPVDMQKQIEDLIKRLEDNKKSILTGDSLFTKTTDKPMTVYRSIVANPTDEWGKALSDKIVNGEVIRDTNLLSTTTQRRQAVSHNFFPSTNTSTKILQIDVPTGTKYFVNPLSKAGKIDPNLGFRLPGYMQNFGYGEDEILFPREIGLQIDPSSNELNSHSREDIEWRKAPQKVQVHKAKIVSPESIDLGGDRLMTEIDSQLEYLQKELQKQISFDNAIREPDVISSSTPTKLTKDVKKVGMTGKQVLGKLTQPLPGSNSLVKSAGAYLGAGLVGALAGEHVLKPAAEKVGFFKAIESGTRAALSNSPDWVAKVADPVLGAAQVALDLEGTAANVMSKGFADKQKQDDDMMIKAGRPIGQRIIPSMKQ